MSSNTFLVVHIPKSAGTSFRWALESFFGKSQVIKDYGHQSNATSDVVREHLYSANDSKGLQTLIEAVSEDSFKILMGHVRLSKYANFFESQNVITFVREPLVRTCSEYLHRLNNKTFTGSLSEFIQKPGYQNQQSKILKGVSVDSFIGITEEYNESLRRINSANQWNLSIRKKNIGRLGGGQRLADNLSTGEVELFQRMNQIDLALYRNAKQKFDSCESATSTSGELLKWFRRS